MFLDFLGPLGGDSVQTWSNTSANAATAKAVAQITSAVRRGFLTRAAADWNVRSLGFLERSWAFTAQQHHQTL